METIHEDAERDYELDKVKKKYDYLRTEVQLVELERDENGLGLSLAGHKDRSKMAVLVCGINPNGSAYKVNNIRVGDEILEVNGIVLQGRCHLNASAIIKGLAGPTFKIIISRGANALDELAVKPLTQFPVTLKELSPEEKYANFKGLKVVTMKKGPHGLGIMIIEGKHAEVGKGIFISDIQEGSVAEQAGLTVGDMILSVNKDTILGSSYDSAASLLKKTEGIVKLVVCNPNKAKEEEIKSSTANSSSTLSVTKDTKKPMSSPTTKGSSTSATASVVTDSATTETPEQPPEPPPDPTTAPIKAGQDCTIQINKENTGLGLSIVGGCDTPLDIVMVHELLSGGAAHKDGRLKPGDQILRVNSEDFSHIPHDKAVTTLLQTLSEVTMVVYRHEEIEEGKEEDMLDILQVEVEKKPSKGLGLSLIGRKNGTGVFIKEIVPGGAIIADGRLIKGDQILSVNGEDLKKASHEEAAAILKLTNGTVRLTIGRLKPRPSPSTSDKKQKH